MKESYPIALHFSSSECRKVEADFSGGDITGNGGIPLLSKVDRRFGWTRAVAGYLDDSRRQASRDHSLSDIVRQRVHAPVSGHEDLKDHQELVATWRCRQRPTWWRRWTVRRHCAVYSNGLIATRRGRVMRCCSSSSWPRIRSRCGG